MNAKIGQITRVLNKTRKGNASKHYFAIWADDNGKPTALLLTEQELSCLKKRADKNVSDLPTLNLPKPRSGSFFNRFFRNSRR
tara:strand:- start:22903 stop:23151 length:249 start_codon:yes stop_codon:yes gene_type:complete